MSERSERSAWEEARIDLRSVTPGQRYTAGIVLLLAVAVLSTGMPDGVVESSSTLGTIPDLSAEAGATEPTSDEDTEPEPVAPTTTTTSLIATPPPTFPASTTTSTPTSTPTTTTSLPATTTTTTTTSTTTTTAPPLLPLP